MMRSRGSSASPQPKFASAIPTEGISDSSKGTLAAAIRHFEDMRTSNAASRADFPNKWEDCSVAVLTNMDTYARMAFYLFELKKKGGDTLDAKTIVNYTSALLNNAKNRLYHEKDVTPDTIKFFECLIVGSTSDIAKKWGRLKDNVRRFVVLRALSKGESPVEGGERPLYINHIQSLIEAYALDGSPEAMRRKLMIDVAWLSGGRGGEMANLTWEGLLVDPHFRVVYTDAVQLKVSAMKTVVFAAGANRHLDFFLNFFDYLVHGPHLEAYVPGGANFIFPDWQRTASPSTTLSNIIKALIPCSKGSKFAIRVKGLHSDACAGGIRVGAVNLLTSRMPAEFAAYLTGHILKGIGALFEYLRVEIAKLAAAVVVMSGFPALPWGLLGNMPVPASLDPLRLHIACDKLQVMIDKLCRLNSCSPPMLLRSNESSVTEANDLPSVVSLGTAKAGAAGTSPSTTGPKRARNDPSNHASTWSANALTEELPAGGCSIASERGELRFALEAGLASAIMYYPERSSNRECVEVNRALEDALMDALSSADAVSAKPSRSDVQRVLMSWSSLIRDKFVVDNAHLTMPQCSSAGSNSGELFAALQRSTDALRSSTEAGFAQLNMRLEALTTAVAKLSQAVVHLSTPVVGAVASPAIQHTHCSPVSASVMPALSAASPLACAESVAPAGVSQPIKATDVIEPTTSMHSALAVRSTSSTALGSLADLRPSAGPRSLAGKTAVQAMSYYFQHDSHESGYSVQDYGRLSDLVAAFNAMATPEELTALRPAGSTASGTASLDGVDCEQGARQTILESIDLLIRRRFYVLLLELGRTKTLLLSKRLLAGAVSERIMEINKCSEQLQRKPLTNKKSTLERDLRSDFQTWRKAGASIVPTTFAAVASPLVGGTAVDQPCSSDCDKVISVAGVKRRREASDIDATDGIMSSTESCEAPTHVPPHSSKPATVAAVAGTGTVSSAVEVNGPQRQSHHGQLESPTTSAGPPVSQGKPLPATGPKIGLQQAWGSLKTLWK